MLSKCRKPVNISILIIFILLPTILNQEQEKHWTRRKVVSGKILTEQTLNQTLNGKTLELDLRQKEQILNKDKPGKMMYFEVKSVSTKVGPGQILTRRKSKKDRTRTNVGTG